MVDFYCHYNGAEIYLSVYTNKIDEFEADIIYPIKYTFSSDIPTMEELIEWDRMDGFVSPNMIPFVQDQGGDSCYCDTNTGEIYIIRSDGIDNPIKLGNSFLEFLKGLNVCE